MLTVLLWISHKSATNPWLTIVLVLLLSIAMAAIGFFTNFTVDHVDEASLWTPVKSRVLKHSNWILNKSRFPKLTQDLFLLIHSDGGNVLGRSEVENVFKALDSVRNLSKYDDVCSKSASEDRYGVLTCPITGDTSFWNDTLSMYSTQVTTDKEAIQQLSALNYPDGVPVNDQIIFGLPKRAKNERLLSAQAYLVVISLPETEEAEDFEEQALNAILALANSWDADPTNSLRLEAKAKRSLSDEYVSIQCSLLALCSKLTSTQYL